MKHLQRFCNFLRALVHWYDSRSLGRSDFIYSVIILWVSWLSCLSKICTWSINLNFLPDLYWSQTLNKVFRIWLLSPFDCYCSYRVSTTRSQYLWIFSSWLIYTLWPLQEFPLRSENAKRILPDGQEWKIERCLVDKNGKPGICSENLQARHHWQGQLTWYELCWVKHVSPRELAKSWILDLV